ncbi:transglycosylase SLT domain-containing protein [Neorhizobium galegae]|uniref:transglycosylase SLT domain-containing protein n=1 Tax=Neorhizobium galegae TaxID=399 RepID=UPI001270C3A5|nr:transglycosylase SLT domain-containing protein [Neorhizobium galegae]KAA9388101.1 transglycosylase SLT domain-containing protein [Neorhizobium galegae]KAB1115438.1 transglycosylase SLT domain-containing protein [Neorhizobium galegae]MCM2498370.1 transglycosylase SLT domain-containing protein [Neorhizobium galegae]MCQ1766052.1 transglycosylase SLT domain-containing protein [Neorhizobium galegae]MCQ1773283.1 transglycosylase SLT domain-containing protein [Neorhizobium galegae]
MRIAFFIALLTLSLSACASAPSRVTNACAIFEQRDGLFNNWARDAKKAEREFGVPVPILMATIYVESGFQPYARPPRTKLLGFIPWTRASTAYGYAQALDGTWLSYKKDTGRWSASRTDFGDAVHFVGWYHNQSHLKNGIPLTDSYNLYLAYYTGQAGYARGQFGNGVKQTAQKSAGMAAKYEAQLRSCGY